MKERSDEKKVFEHEFGDVLKEAKSYEKRCFAKKRWGGDPILIVVDSALDSIGLNYFRIVVPRVKRFNEKYILGDVITSFEDFSKHSPDDNGFLEILKNKRAWGVAINVCNVLNVLGKEKNLKDDFEALRNWANAADYNKWKDDAIGKINGVGLITFQYLRMQAGVDTSMPDKIIKKAAKDYFGLEAKSDIEFIGEMEKLSNIIGYSQILICWVIWLAESDLSLT